MKKGATVLNSEQNGFEIEEKYMALQDNAQFKCVFSL